MTRLIALTLALLLPGLAQAACTGGAQTAFSCTTKGGQNQLQICIDGRIGVYTYGPRGAAPDLTLARRAPEFDYVPWNGIGRYIWEETTFYNAGYAYAVWYSIDKMRPNAPVEGGVTVSRSKKVIAEIKCDPGSVDARFDGLSGAFARSGLCWDPGRQVWGGCR